MTNSEFESLQTIKGGVIHQDAACYGLEKVSKDNLVSRPFDRESFLENDAVRPCRLCALEDTTVLALSKSGPTRKFVISSRRPEELRRAKKSTNDEFVSPATERLLSIAGRSGLRANKVAGGAFAWGDVPLEASDFVQGSFWTIALDDLLDLSEARGKTPKQLTEALETFLTFLIDAEADNDCPSDEELFLTALALL